VTCIRCRTTPADALCCSSHNALLCHACYRRTHFVEVCVPDCRRCAREGLPVQYPTTTTEETTAVPEHTMNPAEHREHAARIVRSHAMDVEVLSIWEMCSHLEPTGGDVDAIAAMCRTAQVTVTWPGATLPAGKDRRA